MGNRRHVYWILVAMVVAAFARAAAPASLGGKIFYQSGTTATVGLRAYGATGYLLHPDGRYTRLYSLGWDITRATGGWQAPVDGSYEYVRTATDSATLTMQPAGFARVQRQLTFVSDQRGTIEPPPLVLQNYTFWLGDASTPAPLTNVSLRAMTGGGTPAIAGFVITGLSPRAALIRAVGPGLAGFGVPGFLGDPKLNLPNVAAPVNANDDWETGNNVESIRRVEALTGAFPLSGGSADAALIVPALSPGAYTVPRRCRQLRGHRRSADRSLFAAVARRQRTGAGSVGSWIDPPGTRVLDSPACGYLIGRASHFTLCARLSAR